MSSKNHRKSRGAKASEVSVGSTSAPSANPVVLADPHFDGYTLRNREIPPETVDGVDGTGPTEPEGSSTTKANCTGDATEADDPHFDGYSLRTREIPDPRTDVTSSSSGQPEVPYDDPHFDGYTLRNREIPDPHSQEDTVDGSIVGTTSASSAASGKGSQSGTNRRRTQVEPQPIPPAKPARTPRSRSTANSASTTSVDVTPVTNRRATRSAAAAVPSPAKPPALRGAARKTPKRSRADTEDSEDNNDDASPESMSVQSQSSIAESVLVEIPGNGSAPGVASGSSRTPNPKRARKADNSKDEAVKGTGRRQSVMGNDAVAEGGDATPAKRGRKSTAVSTDNPGTFMAPTPRKGRRRATSTASKIGDLEDGDGADGMRLRADSEVSVATELTMGTTADSQIVEPKVGQRENKDVQMDDAQESPATQFEEGLMNPVAVEPDVVLTKNATAETSAATLTDSSQLLSPSAPLPAELPPVIAPITVAFGTQTIIATTADGGTQTFTPHLHSLGITVKPTTSSAYAQADLPLVPDPVAPLIAQVADLQSQNEELQKSVQAANSEKAKVLEKAKAKDTVIEQMRKELEQKLVDIAVQRRAQEELGASAGAKLEKELKACEDERRKLEEERQGIQSEHQELRRRWLLVREVRKTQWDEIDWNVDADLNEEEKPLPDFGSENPTIREVPSDNGASSVSTERLFALSLSTDGETQKLETGKKVQMIDTGEDVELVEEWEEEIMVAKGSSAVEAEFRDDEVQNGPDEERRCIVM
ncbi:hypothetical protein M427DRAFT_52848 [Gonapodya prolifera JEL478]|uniref:Uncharacterized protein n=1 Tax=Gonapodya prolifera (strain JEL478) TaxID=1344416 RepID=A0A139ARN8_GONPJ|nr:hypothetical protein M427DRAFT_52848 [Gonapodya prolifera JEL478]|eukprot:KXS19407.1 hypothetical protein M427DRAFT_52848 [Gonapodya prolifera JEL478]